MEFNSKLFSYENSFFASGALKLPIGEIFQVSELSVIRGGEIAEHIQPCDEITYAISGKAKIYSDNDCTELSGGQIHFIKKGMCHKIEADINENFRYICIGFTANTDYADINEFISLTSPMNYFIKNDDGNVRILSEMLINEFYQKDSQSNTMINLYLSQILISISRLLKNDTVKNSKISNSTSNFTVYHTLRYIDREYMYITSVKSIAEKLSYSEYYLSHLFKEKMGISIKQYILNKKLMLAAELLKTSNLSVGEISEYLSFATQHTFSQAFKRFFKLSPTEFKKANDRKF